MDYKYIKNAVKLSHKIMESIVKNGDRVVDCTVGNGNDTILLGELVGEQGHVYGFDIQSLALENTRKKIILNDYGNRISLIEDGHENIDFYLDGKVNFIIYNLGYLPSGDKDIVTKASSTVESVKKSLDLLDENGVLVIISYIGHEGGAEENKLLEELLISCNQKEFTVLKKEFINQRNNPPVLYMIEKINVGGS